LQLILAPFIFVYVWWGGRERETERDRERQRETERDRERQRETERDRERDRETETHTQRVFLISVGLNVSND